MMQPLVTALALTLALVAAAPAPALAQATPDKKELVARVLKEQQAAADQLARQLVEQPVQQVLQRVAGAAGGVPPEQREAVRSDVQAEARKYVDATFPVVRDRARALLPTTVGPVLESKLTEKELQDVLNVMQQPAWRKYMALNPEMQRALVEKLLPDVNQELGGRLKAFEDAVRKRIAAATPATPAKAAK